MGELAAGLDGDLDDLFEAAGVIEDAGDFADAAELRAAIWQDAQELGAALVDDDSY